MMYAGLAVPAALTSPCWLTAAALGGSSACAASKSEDSAEDMSDVASDFEERCNEDDDFLAGMKKAEVC